MLGAVYLQNCNTEVAFVSIRSAVRAAEGHVLSSAVDVGALESTAVNLHVTELQHIVKLLFPVFSYVCFMSI